MGCNALNPRRLKLTLYFDKEKASTILYPSINLRSSQWFPFVTEITCPDVPQQEEDVNSMTNLQRFKVTGNVGIVKEKSNDKNDFHRVFS